MVLLTMPEYTLWDIQDDGVVFHHSNYVHVWSPDTMVSDPAGSRYLDTMSWIGLVSMDPDLVTLRPTSKTPGDVSRHLPQIGSSQK